MQDGNRGGFQFCNLSQDFIRLTSMVGLCWSGAAQDQQKV